MRLRALIVLSVGAGIAGCAPAAPTADPPATVSAPVPTTAVVPASPPQGTFPTTAPVPGGAAALRLPAPVRRTLPNGLKVMYVRHGSLPVVHATLVLPAGAMNEPATLPGLAAFTAEMLDEGAGGRTSLQLSESLDVLGATLSATTGWDATSINLHVLGSRFSEAINLMADVVVRPDVPVGELRRVREENITELGSARDEARIVAGNAASMLVFGANHPYGRLPAVESTRRFERDSVLAFHRQNYVPGGSTLILVGDVNADQLHPMVERAFGSWTGTARPVSAPANTPYPARTTIYLVDKPGAAQSEIRVGHTGVARTNSDYFPLTVMNTLLGVSFTSRLMTNLRETHGFAYSANSAFSMRLGPGPFVAGAAVFTAKTDSSVVEFLRELRRLHDEPVAPGELQRAKNYVALGLPRQFETTAGVAGQLAQLEIYGIAPDFFNSYVDRIMAVTAADVQRVARQYLQPDRAVVVVVGDRSQVETGLRALQLGPVEIRETSEFVR